MDLKYVHPSAGNYSTEFISSAAKLIINKFSLTPDFDICQLVKKLGGKIITQDFWTLDTSNSGSIVINSTENFKIFIPCFTSDARNKFVIAHELGHYFLHYVVPKVNKPMKALRYSNGQEENQANYFATKLLMCNI